MKSNPTNLLRTSIRELKPYSSARSLYTGKTGVFLDANENPYGVYNRYPDPLQIELKERLCEIKGGEIDQLFVGNGSDEVIDTVLRLFCEPRQDKVLTFTPTYGMYKVSTQIHGVELIEIPLTTDFQIDCDELQSYFKDEHLKLIFLCSPNNPTANSMDSKSIEFILNHFKGIVLIDEAYIDFSDKESWLKRLDSYPNLIISQTLSKAWGMAGLRLGLAYASKNIIGYFNAIKPPYNVSSLNQETALKLLENTHVFQNQLKEIKSEKQRMFNALKMVDCVKTIYPSDSNFILIEVENAQEVYKKLLAKHIVIRNRENDVANCLRITVGTALENTLLITALKTYSNV